MCSTCPCRRFISSSQLLSNDLSFWFQTMQIRWRTYIYQSLSLNEISITIWYSCNIFPWGFDPFHIIRACFHYTMYVPHSKMTHRLYVNTKCENSSHLQTKRPNDQFRNIKHSMNVGWSDRIHYACKYYYPLFIVNEAYVLCTNECLNIQRSASCLTINNETSSFCLYNFRVDINWRRMWPRSVT